MVETHSTAYGQTTEKRIYSCIGG